jgi:SOS-response transcriptional repressor LexA
MQARAPALPAKTVYQNRYDHIRDLIERHGGASKMAEMLGVSRQQISHIASANPIKNIGDRLARRIEMTFGLPIGTIDQPIGIAAIDMDEFSVVVPLLNVTASMGPGAIVPWSEEVVHTMRISKMWIRQNTQASAFDRLGLITAKGDSMTPTFDDGSILLVDTTVTQLRLDAVYVLARGDELFIKRVQRNIDGTFLIKSDNPQYSPQQIEDPFKAGLMVLGRVLLAWSVRKL